MTERDAAPAVRLESLWSGSFGDEYTVRNASAASARQSFWEVLLSEIPVRRVLEVGCNLGANLKWIAGKVPPRDVFGVDINESALAKLRTDQPAVNALWARARDLPFRDGWFDLTFTMGVLIHQPPALLPVVMSEIVRCSRKYVLAGEYFAESLTEVPYRGQSGALFKQDYGSLYASLFPQLRLLKRG